MPSGPISDYRRVVLRRGHKEKVLEYKAAAGTVELSPLGASFVEQQLQKWEAALK
jgi:hypothetical protein